MQLDALTLAAVTDELRGNLPGARIDDVIQPTPQAIALQCWGGGGRNRWLLVSAHPQLARVHLITEKPRKLVAEPPTFVMLLRKHLEGARVLEVRQPRHERILEISFGRSQTAPIWLVCEVMGRLSNVILRDADGLILGALHQVSGAVNTFREILPHTPYRYPPARTRTLNGEPVPPLDGLTLAPDELRRAAEDVLAHQQSVAAPGRGNRGSRKPTPPTVAGLLAAHVDGISRETGREVAARALGQPDAPLTPDLDWAALAEAIRPLAALPETHAWRPTLVYQPPESAMPTAFAVYEPQQYSGARLVAAESANAMLETYFRGSEWRTAVEGAKGQLRDILKTRHKRILVKDEALRGELAQFDEAQQLRDEADLLLAFQSEIPPHQSRVTLENPFVAAENGAAPTVTLELDPRLDAVENANRRYARYHKLQRAAKMIPPLIEANELERARVEQFQTDLALAETPAEIALVRAEIAEAGYLRGEEMQRRAQQAKQGKPAKPAKSGKKGQQAKGKGNQPKGPEGGTPLRRELAGGFVALIGKNSRQNEEVTFRQASANDVWLHARGVPGAHVVIKSGGRPVPEATLQEAASLAAYYSSARESNTVQVDYTEQRYVRHMKGGGPGMVIYERERSLFAEPRG